MGTKNAFVVIFADLGCGVQGIAGATRQETRARVTADRVVASLRWQTVVFLRDRKMLESVKEI